jgi:hypothetical protein
MSRGKRCGFSILCITGDTLGFRGGKSRSLSCNVQRGTNYPLSQAADPPTSCCDNLWQYPGIDEFCCSSVISPHHSMGKMSRFLTPLYDRSSPVHAFSGCLNKELYSTLIHY